MSTAILATLIDNAYRREGLAELQVRESASGLLAAICMARSLPSASSPPL